MRREASGDVSTIGEASFATSSSRDQVSGDAPIPWQSSSMALPVGGLSSRPPSSGNLQIVASVGGGGRRLPSTDQLSATLPSRQDTLSAGHFSVHSPLSPAGSIHSANSTAAFSVGQYRFSYCPICFEHFTVENPAMVLVCGHVFHAQCHLAWRDRSDTCAVCSAVIDDTKVRMMHGTDLHARAGKGPLPAVPVLAVPSAVTQPTGNGDGTPPSKRPPMAPRSPSGRTTANSTTNVGRSTPPPVVLVHVVGGHGDDDLDGDLDTMPRTSQRSGSRGGLAGGVDGFVHTVQRAFACFRCGARSRPPQHPMSSASSMHGGSTRSRPTAQLSASQLRGEVTPLRAERSAASSRASHHSSPPTAAAPYEEQERRMMEQKVQSSSSSGSAA
ncbi:zinc finger protein, putative [Bodo saltans]|uniref:RING-type E3 ubiquitin transferase n=1 Tax=Bodo saltans TaxID=75058 RepID=A0A0S4J358_BODSA|nr:zinc finger protein, putative [Bodo saltans]|eukprot:CUG74956.1 zinc finger protein, putative [Bodo saltans]